MRYRTFLIGRDDDCDLQILRQSVSRAHAELILASSGRIMLVDRCSSQGTFIKRRSGWQKIDNAVVDSGARVRFGDFEIAIDKLVSAARADDKPQPPAPIEDGPPSYEGVIRRNPEDGSVIGR